MDKYIGRLLDNRYEILEVIGTGGMAVVYKARCHRLNRLVAIKILKDDYLEDEDFRRRFHSESQAVAMLGHPNIVSVYDVSTSIMADYIVMELIEGISLKQYMEKKGVLNWKETLHFAMQIGKALEHAHSRGIVHRDIKPHNVMVLKNGSVKVTDFGIARMMSKGNTLTKEALGSVHYISPEQAKGGRVDNRSDIYSLGIVMYEMMCGRPPYDGESPVSVAIQHINGGASMPSLLNPNIPEGLEQIIMKAMAHEVSQRYSSATQMLRDMDEFRKDPALLFDYNATGDDLIKVSRPPLVLDTNGAKTTAERVVDKAEGQNKRTNAATAVVGSASARRRGETGAIGVVGGAAAVSQRSRDREAARRRKEAEQERKQNRIAIIAIISCSAVILFAVVLLLLLLLLGNNVKVPDLVGKYYDTLAVSEDYVVVKHKEVYDDDFELGQIVSQDPVAGKKIRKGETIWVTVSVGPGGLNEPVQTAELENLVGKDVESARNIITNYGLKTPVELDLVFDDKIPRDQVIRTMPEAGAIISTGDTVTLTVSLGKQPEMPDLTDKTEEEAKEILDALDLNFKYKPATDYSETVEKGCVIETEPAKGSKLEYGETITLVVSEGAEVIMAKMPNVVGFDSAQAVSMLISYGFKNHDFIHEENAADKGEIIGQSVDPNAEIDVTTLIVLTVSKGPGESQNPTTSAKVTKNVQIMIPTEQNLRDKGLLTEDAAAEDFSFTITIQQGSIVYATFKDVKIGQDPLTLDMTGSGEQVYDILINSQPFSTIVVDFTTK